MARAVVGGSVLGDGLAQGIAEAALPTSPPVIEGNHPPPLVGDCITTQIGRNRVVGARP